MEEIYYTQVLNNFKSLTHFITSEILHSTSQMSVQTSRNNVGN